MKVEIQAGAKLDVLSPDEMDDKLGKLSKSWMTELARGVKFRDLPATKTTVAAGTWSIGATGDQLRPNPGFVWAVTRLAVTGGGLVQGTDTYSIFKNDVSGAKTVRINQQRQSIFHQTELVLTESDSLIVTGVGTGVAVPPDVILAGAVIELPIQLAWQLL